MNSFRSRGVFDNPVRLNNFLCANIWMRFSDKIRKFMLEICVFSEFSSAPRAEHTVLTEDECIEIINLSGILVDLKDDILADKQLWAKERTKYLAEVLFNRCEIDGAEILCHKVSYMAESREQGSVYIIANYLLALISVYHGNNDQYKEYVKNFMNKYSTKTGYSDQLKQMSEICMAMLNSCQTSV